LHCFDLAAVVTLYAGQTALQIALVLKDIQVTPLAHGSVIIVTHRATIVRTLISLIKTGGRLDNDAHFAVYITGIIAHQTIQATSLSRK
jgi:hypothetical protein